MSVAIGYTQELLCINHHEKKTSCFDSVLQSTIEASFIDITTKEEIYFETYTFQRHFFVFLLLPSKTNVFEFISCLTGPA